MSWTPEEGAAGPAELPRAARRLVDVGWRGLVTVGIAPDGELAEVAAGFSLDIAVLERAHGVDAVELALRSAAGGRRRRRARAGVPRGPPSPSSCGPTLPPGTAGPGHRPAARDRLAAGRRATDVELVAVSGYEPGDRLDGWYDALLATVSAAGPDTATAAARRRPPCCRTLPDVGVPHDGAEVCAVLGRLAAGSSVPSA